MQNLRIFTFADYKKYVLKRIEALPNAGRGQLQKLAEALRVHPTLISQVLRGPKHLTSEQASLAAVFFGLNDTESDYLLAMVEHERAGNSVLKKSWRRRLDALRAENETIQSRTPPATTISDEQKFRFYSSWEYSGVRLATSIQDMSTPEAIAERLAIPVGRVNEIVASLIEMGLCVRSGNRVKMGPTRTHVAHPSPLAQQHSSNWRLKALQFQRPTPHEVMFTYPVTIAKDDRHQVREILAEAIERISALVAASGSEELCCLVIDWFDVRKVT